MDKIFNINLNGQNYEIQDRPLTEQVATLEGEVAGKLDATAYTPYDDSQVKADIQANTTAIAGKQDKGNYALSGSSYTKAESDAKYLTEHQSLTAYAKTADVNAELAKKQDKGDYALKSEIPTIPLFKTINGQAITGNTDNIVIESGSDIELPISSDDVAVKVDILTKGKQLSSGDTFTSRYLFVELDMDGSANIYFTDGTYIKIYFGRINDKSPEFSNATIVSNKNGDYVDFGDIVTLTLGKSDSTVYIGTTVDTLTNSLADLNNKKQDTLVSGSNIKRLYSKSYQDLLGSGNIYIPTINGYDMAAVSPNAYYVKSINNQSVFGSTPGNIDVQPTLVSGQNIKTINGQSIVGKGNITIEDSGSDMSNYYTKTEIDNMVGNINNALNEI